jgi:prepilin-type processing-associated H-X9-DG protein
MVIIAIAHTKKGGGFFSRLIIAILAAILFPVFAKAREKARQTACLNNQRQIALAIQMYTQDHEELLPAAAEVWGAINLDKGVLICPTAGKKQANGYVYSSLVAGIALGEIADPTAEVLVADGKALSTAVANPAANVLYAPGDLDWRHANGYIAAFVDGHAGLMKTAPAFGLAALGSKNGVGAVTVTYNAATPTVPPVVTLPSGTVPKTTVGSSGYVLPRWKTISPPTSTGATPTKAFFAPFTDTFTTEYFSTGNSWCMTNIVVNGTSGSAGTPTGTDYGAVGSVAAGTTLSVPINVTDTALHTLTIITGARFSSIPHSRYTITTDTGAGAGREASAMLEIPAESAPNLLQFTFRFKCKLTLYTVTQHSDPYTKTSVAGIFFD